MPPFPISIGIPFRDYRSFDSSTSLRLSRERSKILGCQNERHFKTFLIIRFPYSDHSEIFYCSNADEDSTSSRFRGKKSGFSKIFEENLLLWSNIWITRRVLCLATHSFSRTCLPQVKSLMYQHLA